MKYLTFQYFDSFFIDNKFFQILQIAKSQDCILRSQNGTIYSLNTTTPVEIYKNCNAQIKNPIGNSNSFAICFDVPENIKISKSNALESDEFQDNIVTPNASERIIDQLLEEEFLINSEFLLSFASQCFFGIFNKTTIARASYRSAQQIRTGGDESDLIVLIEHENKTYALLIENKITASPQKHQDQRYIERGINGIKGQLWYSFTTILIAPEKYLQARRHEDYYHHYISYEKIISILENTISDKPRLKFRVDKFNDAISKKDKHIPAPDIVEVVAFVENIKKLSNEFVPHLSLKTGRTNAKVMWFYFSEKNYPNGVKIIIKMEAVVVEFQLPKCKKFIKGKEAIFEQNGFDFLIANSGKSCTIRKKIDPINCLLPLESQKENIKKSLNFVNEMDRFLRQKIF